MDETAKQSVFLHIQVCESNQTKGLERGWKQRARLGRDAKNTDGRFGINFKWITRFNLATGNSHWLNLDALVLAVNKLSSYVYNKSFAMFPTMMIFQGAKHLTFAGEVEGVGMGDFRKKYPAHWFERENILARKYLGKKYPVLKKCLSRPIILQHYMLGKKIPSPEIWGKASLPRGGSSINR